MPIIFPTKLAKSCIIYLTKKTKIRLPLKLSLLCGSRPKSARASPQHLAHTVPDFMKIGSLSVELAECVKTVLLPHRVFAWLALQAYNEYVVHCKHLWMTMQLDVDAINHIIRRHITRAAEMSFELAQWQHRPCSISVSNCHRHQCELHFSYCICTQSTLSSVTTLVGVASAQWLTRYTLF